MLVTSRQSGNRQCLKPPYVSSPQGNSSILVHLLCPPREHMCGPPVESGCFLGSAHTVLQRLPTMDNPLPQ